MYKRYKTTARRTGVSESDLLSQIRYRALDVATGAETEEAIIDYKMLLHDALWKARGRTTIFVPSKIVSWLGRCSFDIQAVPTPFTLPAAILFEEGSTFFGSWLSPTLCSYPLQIDGEIMPQFRVIGGEMHAVGGMEQHAEAASGGTTIIIDHGSSSSGGDYTTAELSQVLKTGDSRGTAVQKDLKYYSDELGSMKSGMDYAAFRFHTAIICMYVRVYCDAFPEAMVPGPPMEKYRGRNKPMRISGRCLRIRPVKQITADRSGPVPHFRHGHFRQLRDERFHKNPDGSNRTVFVKASIVKGKVKEVYTVEKKESADNANRT